MFDSLECIWRVQGNLTKSDLAGLKKIITLKMQHGWFQKQPVTSLKYLVATQHNCY